MNIVIVEQLNRANRQSLDILASSREQSLKRRNQIQTYNYTRENTWYNNIISAIKTYWYC